MFRLLAGAAGARVVRTDLLSYDRRTAGAVHRYLVFPQCVMHNYSSLLDGSGSGGAVDTDDTSAKTDSVKQVSIFFCSFIISLLLCFHF